MPDVQGRLDHIALDVNGKRLFVPANGDRQNAVEVFDLKAVYAPSDFPDNYRRAIRAVRFLFRWPTCFAEVRSRDSNKIGSKNEGTMQGTSKFLALSFHNFAFPGAPSNSLKILFLRGFDPHRPYQCFSKPPTLCFAKNRGTRRVSSASSSGPMSLLVISIVEAHCARFV
jgi:hypothetical protein